MSSIHRDDLDGCTIGLYRVLRRLSAGGMAVVRFGGRTAAHICVTANWYEEFRDSSDQR